MPPSILSYALTGSFIVTLFLLQWWQRSSYSSLLLGIVGILGIVGVVHRRWSLGTAASLGVALALTTVTRTTHAPSPQTADFYANGTVITLHGFIIDEPDSRARTTKYILEADALSRNETESIAVRGRVLITDYKRAQALQYGDEVTVRGKLRIPKPIGEFAYDAYLGTQKVFSILNAERIEYLSSDHGSPLLKALYILKARFEHQITLLLPEPHASLLAGLLTGSRHGIPRELMAHFNATSLTHLIAISGYNITIVLSLLSGMLFFLPLRLRIIPATLAIIAYTFFVGAGASVVRAAIMGTLGLLALHTQRIRTTRLTILWTAFLMLLWNPKQLWHDPGFQLSFLAVIGISELSPFLTDRLRRVPDFLGLRETLQTTIAAQLFTAPLIAFLFDRFSIVSPLANVLVAPAVPLAMLFGFLGTAMSFVWFPAGEFLSPLAQASLDWIITVAETFGDLPLASLSVPWFSRISLVACYTMTVWFIITIGRGGSSSLPFPMEPSFPQVASSPESGRRVTRRASLAEAPGRTSPQALP